MENNTEKNTDRDMKKRRRYKSLVRNLKRGPKKRKKDGTAAFYIETLVLLALFTVIAVVLVNGFLAARRLSMEAEMLSGAVHLAENAAEMAAASDSGEMLLSLLDENGNACVLEQADSAGRSVYRAKYDADRMPAANGIFYVDVSWVPEKDGLVKCTVAVYRDNRADPLYTLNTAVYRKQ